MTEHQPAISTRSDRRIQTVEVRHDPEGSRFEILVEGALAGFSMYTHEETGASRQRVFFHTVIDDVFGQRGLAGTLTRSALEASVQEGYRLVAVCPYVARWLRTHHDVDDAVDAVRPSHLEAVRRVSQRQNGPSA